MENDAGAVGKGAAGRYAGNKYTLLDPEKTSAGNGSWVFGQDKRLLLGQHIAEGVRAGVGVVGGGWLLVEMCIVDASILFFCDLVFC